MTRWVNARARPKQAPGSMNKLEQAYASHLQLLKMAGEVIEFKYEALKLRLADNTFLTPDFLVQTPEGYLELHETKGFWEEDARIKIKVAAALYPMFRFVGVKRAKTGFEYEAF